jgi:multicomponent Na+:H+ antiporter subunit F
MSAQEFLGAASTVAMALLMLAMLLTVVRIIIGPTLADRVLALDSLTVIAMSVVGTSVIQTGFTLYLDIVIALALVGFLATVALARYILARAAARPKDTGA